MPNVLIRKIKDIGGVVKLRSNLETIFRLSPVKVAQIAGDLKIVKKRCVKALPIPNFQDPH